MIKELDEEEKKRERIMQLILNPDEQSENRLGRVEAILRRQNRQFPPGLRGRPPDECRFMSSSHILRVTREALKGKSDSF